MRRDTNSVKKKVGIVAAIGVIGFYALKSCAALEGNTDIIDTKKSFNIAIDENEDAISITNIISYNDYSGSQVQFTTQDNLVVLTSTIDTQLLSQYNYSLVREYALSLANGDESKIYSYDELQGMSLEMYENSWNKGLLDLQYTYTHALIKSENCLTIAEIDSWSTYSEDDKIQLTLTNGTTILKDITDVKLVDNSNASDDSVYNYALSLVGDADKINYYSAKKLVK